MNKQREQRYRRSLALQKAGQRQAAIAELRGLASEAMDSPALLAQLIRALVADSQSIEAEQWAERGVSAWPLDGNLQLLLAKLRWQRGDPHFAAELERAIASCPDQLQLRLVAANLWRNAGEAQRALSLAMEGMRFTHAEPALLTSIGLLLEDLGRSAEALSYLSQAVAYAPTPRFRTNLIPTLLRVRKADEAQRIVSELLIETPADPQLIAYQALIHRQLGHRSAYRELYDYERLVRTYPLHTDSIECARFNRAFARELLQLHRSKQHPIDQSLRGGTQTDRHLPLQNATVAEFFRLIDPAIRDYIGTLNHGHHIFDRRRLTGYRVTGSWSVALQSGGFHLNHIHPQGWISSAYYVQVPELPDEPGAGWLKFGEPGIQLDGMQPGHF
ncbi:MAG TPA: putative 2OG-Fe(II) oxygenase, partial [Steroidobacteraceae bacterium]|nr:putative 2OG-Fe(II) oxygenase [Steroidobacteraceae bacterium]